MGSSWENVFMQDVQKEQGNGLQCKIEELLKARLEKWKEVEISFGITGNSGVGKSSLINAIRGLEDEDEGAAKTDVTETTTEPAKYPHPTNSNIIFWDLPGIGTPNYPDLETYCNKVGLENYNTFLILTAGRFTENDLALAKKVTSLKKSFFFIRTKIDQDYTNEKRKKKKAFNEEAMLKNIMEDCLKNLQGLQNDDKDVFLISNPEPAKWDFPRLTRAILDVLPFRQKEALTLSLGLLTRDMVKQKADLLRGRIWMVATASAAAALVPLPGLSMAVDTGMILREVNFYKVQLGLPGEDSNEFKSLPPEIKRKVEKFCISSPWQMAKLFAATYAIGLSAEESTRFIPIIGQVLAGAISFYTTKNFLHECLNELEEAALEFFDQTVDQTVMDVD